MKKIKKPNVLSGLGQNTPQSFEGYGGLIYARVSSKRQEIEGSGLTSQETRCKSELAQIKVPWERTFSDSFTGGGDFMNRPAMRELLAYIDARPYKKFVVVFDDLKRFARDTEFHLKLRTAFRIREVVLRCLNYTFNETPEGRFAELIMAGQAELEKEQNKRQVIQKEKARMDDGYYAFRHKKGYTMTPTPGHGKISIPNKTALEVLKPALEGFANGTLLKKIDVVRYLMSKGYWKTQRAEKYIDKVTDILKDSFHAGYIEYPAWEVFRRKGKHQGIISLETYELIQKRLQKDGLHQNIRKDTSEDFPLRGLIVHDECKGHITSAWYPNGKGKKYPKYVCHTKDCPNYNVPFSANDVHERFEKVLKKGALKKEVVLVLKKVFDRVWQDEISKIQTEERDSEQQKRALEQKLLQYMELRRTAPLPPQQRAYDKQIETTQLEIEAMEKNSTAGIDMSVPYQTALQKASMLLKMPDIAWKKFNVNEQHDLFFFFFQEKLPYSIKNGYQTHQIPYAVRLFEDFVTENTHLVEMPGVKPGSKTNSSSDCSQD